MRTLNSCIFLFITTTSLVAPADDLWMAKIRSGHPRMFFNAETWPQVKARAEGPARAARDALLKRCDGYPDNPVCADYGPVVFREVKTASGTHKTTAATPINSVKEWGPQAAECALAWRFTGERKYLVKARKMLESSVAAYHAAYRNGRAVNWYSTTRILALCAYDWIWEGLTPDERKAIIVPLVRHVEDVQPGKGKPNIIRRDTGGIASGFYGVPSLLWYSGLAAFGDGYCDGLAKSHLQRGHGLCLKLLKFRNDGAGDDGALSSAVPGYSMGAYPWAHFNFFHTWLSATGENLAPSYPGMALFPNWIYWTWIPNEVNPDMPLYCGFGDDQHTHNALAIGRLYEHMSQYIHFFRDANPAAARLAASLRDRAPSQNMGAPWVMYPFLFGDEDGDVKPYSAEELERHPLHARHFENLGQIIMRSGWKPDSTYCTFTAGAKLHQHKHYDENNFTIYKHDFLALDSGTRGVETDWNLKYYYAQTVAHNCMLIRRPNEPLPSYWGPVYPGPEGKCNDGGMYKGSANVLAFETNDSYTYVASDATALYGKKCTEAVRQFIHLLPDTFVVYDRVGAAVPSDAKAWLLHTKDEPRIEGRLLTADSGKGRLFCETILPEDATLTKIGGPGKEFLSNGKNWEPDTAFLASAERAKKRTGRGPYFGAWRLEVSPGAARENDRFLHVLTATDTATHKPPKVRKVSENGRDGVVVEVPKVGGGTTEVTILFNREGPVGGTIAFGNDAPRSFSTTVQPQSGVWPTATGTEFAPDGVPFIVAEKPWLPDGLGNHRAVVRVAETGKVVRTMLKWRRVDPQPEIKRVLVKHAVSGADAAHVIARNVTAETGEVYFEPSAGVGEYFIYYMPYRERNGSSEGRHQPLWNDYLPAVRRVEDAAPYQDVRRVEDAAPYQDAEVLRFESRTSFEAWTPMGLRATAAETAALRRAHPETPVVFTEDRTNPIHPASWLPAKWANGAEVRNSFSGTALKDEYYVWQIALWTPGGALEDVKVKFSDLVLDGGRAVAPRPPDAARSGSAPYQMDGCRMSSSSITCFNTEGVNWDGKAMDIKLDVPANRLQPLWCGVMIPPNAVPGVYRGTATITAKGMSPRTVALAINVADEMARDHGDGELWRHSRLRWLNSRIGESDTPTKPYKAMSFDREVRRVVASEKALTLAESGLPASIKVNGREVLKKPMRFMVVTEKGEFDVGAGTFVERETERWEAKGHVAWRVKQQAYNSKDAAGTGRPPYQVVVNGRMEFDGFVRYVVEVAAEGDVKVKDVRLVTEYTPYASQYLMGAAYMGRDGGRSPQAYSWDWKNGYYDSYWSGGPEAGLHVEFRGGAYHGPLIADRSYSYKPPQAWANDGKGRIEFGGTDGMTVVARTGETSLSTTPRKWEFDLNITPVKPVDLKKQFSQRYFHADPARFDEVAAHGANIVNIHHAQLLNPVINYPFIVQKELKEYIADQHAKGRKVKLYYTIRELSNHVAELQALRSLGGEVIAPGNAHGAPWMWEHMGEGYRPAWYVRMWDGSYVDAAFVTSPRSRWINYYLEGLRWMFENYEIDGIYMDDVCFDRTVMKRMRRIIEKYRPGALVDLHSNTGYSKGPMNQYTEFFPYVDRLWFGESFKYDELSPDAWFVTFSGIPFGQMSEMLQGGGNRWLGAVYGTTRRCYMDFSTGNPYAIWKAWDEFGIEDARMIGYWDEHPAVTTDSPDVKATAFVRDGRTLVALGNFAKEPRTVRLSIDWKRLGLDPSKVKIEARPIQGFQDGRTFAVGETISIPAKRGWMLWLW